MVKSRTCRVTLRLSTLEDILSTYMDALENGTEDKAWFYKAMEIAEAMERVGAQPYPGSRDIRDTYDHEFYDVGASNPEARTMSSKPQSS